MPTASDDWVVEAVLQYRVQYGVEQWYVKWKDYDDNRNTWEPWANLLTPELQAEARAVKEAALPHDEVGLRKMTVPFLKEALEVRKLEAAHHSLATRPIWCSACWRPCVLEWGRL